MNAPHLTILADLDRLNVEVEVRGDRLHLDAPAGVMTPDLLARIKHHKAALLASLACDDQHPPIVRAARTEFPDAVVDSSVDSADVDESMADAPANQASVNVNDVNIDGAQPDGTYRASNPARQPVIDLLYPIAQRDPVQARDLADAWMERIAIVEADADCHHAAEAVAYAELVQTLAQRSQT